MQPINTSNWHGYHPPAGSPDGHPEASSSAGASQQTHNQTSSTSQAHNAYEGYPSHQGESSSQSHPQYPHVSMAARQQMSSNEMARQIYKEKVVYHVTEKKYVKGIRKHGLTTDRKKSKDGATAYFVKKNGDNLPESIVDKAKKNGKDYNFLMDNKAAAQALGRNFKDPAIVRMMADRNIFEEDTDFRRSDGSALRTKEPIYDVLRSKSKKADSSEQAMMKREFAINGIQISSKDAGKSLKEVQSDSEDDF